MDASEWDQRYSTTELIWTAEANRFVVAETESMPAGRALDLAAGEGRNAIWLAQRGWTATAVDFSEVALEKGGQLASRLGVADRLAWVCADVVTWTPHQAAYDLVVIAYLHLPADELTTVVGHAARALSPGGNLVVVGHDVTNLRGGTGGPQDASILYTPEGVRAAADVAGLTVTKARTVERPTASGAARDTLVTAVRLGS